MQKIICTSKNKDENVYFLGSWALKKNKLLDEKRRQNIFKYHWDDRKKLIKDYEYLEKFTYKVTKKLSKILNKVHKTNLSQKYWDFLLFPWILSYNSIIYDRWETIKNIEIKKKNFYLEVYENTFNEYVCDYKHLLELSQKNNWNENLYLKIIKFNKLDHKLKVKKNNLIKKEKKYQSLNRLIFSSVKFFIQPIIKFKFRKKVLMLNTQYNFQSYLKYFNIKNINYGFNLLEKFNSYFMKFYNETYKRVYFNSFLKKNKTSNKFEEFYWLIFKDYFPEIFLEYYNYLSYIAIQRPDYKKIYTSFSHFNDVSDKFYIANQLKKKNKIYVFEHGGSLPAIKELFNFEEKIFDKKYTFYKPIKENQKLIDLNPYYLKFNKYNEPGENCCIFCGETPRWNYRIQFYATSSQSIATLKLVNKFIEGLSDEIKNKVLIKTKQLYSGFNFKNYYRINKNLIYKEKDTAKFISKAKILVLTYPETTLVEAVLSKRPFVMIYSKKFYERHFSTREILKKLTKNNIIFTDPKLASIHINRYWKNPEDWFQKKSVQETISLLKNVYFPKKKLVKKINL